MIIRKNRNIKTTVVLSANLLHHSKYYTDEKMELKQFEYTPLLAINFLLKLLQNGVNMVTN